MNLNAGNFLNPDAELISWIHSLNKVAEFICWIKQLNFSESILAELNCLINSGAK